MFEIFFDDQLGITSEMKNSENELKEKIKENEFQT